MNPNSPVTTIVLIGLMIVAFYFLMIRPQRKRQQKQQETLNSLQPGTRVLLGSGVFGTIIRIGDKQAVLELSPGNQLTVLKQAIVRAALPEDEDTVDPDAPVSEPAGPASTLDLTETEAAAGTTEQTPASEADQSTAESGEPTWREYTIPQNDDDAAEAGPAAGPEPGSDAAAVDQAETQQTADQETKDQGPDAPRA